MVFPPVQALAGRRLVPGRLSYHISCRVGDLLAERVHRGILLLTRHTARAAQLRCQHWTQQLDGRVTYEAKLCQTAYTLTGGVSVIMKQAKFILLRSPCLSSYLVDKMNDSWFTLYGRRGVNDSKICRASRSDINVSPFMLRFNWRLLSCKVTDRRSSPEEEI